MKKFKKFINESDDFDDFDFDDFDFDDEFDWDEEEKVYSFTCDLGKYSILKSNVINKPPNKWTALKKYDLSSDKLPYIIEMNVCGLHGSDAPMEFSRFLIDNLVVECLNDSECIGFNYHKKRKRHLNSGEFITNKKINKLIPVYKRAYEWEYDDEFPFKHVKESHQSIRVYREDWKKFVDMLSNGKWGQRKVGKYVKSKKPLWCAHHNWDEVTYDDFENYYDDRDYIYVYGFSGCLIPHSDNTKKYRYSKYYVDFKDILNHKATYKKY